jgi:hypothetical protein
LLYFVQLFNGSLTVTRKLSVSLCVFSCAASLCVARRAYAVALLLFWR